MVGPLSSEEIEDVVSSVRRLVSNELHPRNVSRDLHSERLILTAALRVVPEPGPLAPLVLDAPVVEAARDGAPEGDGTAVAPDEAVAEPVRAGPAFVAEDAAEDLVPAMALDAGPVADIEPDLTPAYLAPMAEAGLLADAPADAPERDAATAEPVADDPADHVEAAWEDAIWVEPAPVSLAELALASEEAEVLTGPATTPEPASDAPSDAAAPDEWDQADSAWSGSDDPVPFVPLRRRAEQLSARLASGEMPAMPSSDSGSQAEKPREDLAAGPATTEFVDADGMALAVLDEAALQDIVRQTLRAELQGDLGERITRNIRKLVRAEINRAFLARDLD